MQAVDDISIGVINLRHRPERWQHIQTHWVHSGILPQSSRLEAFRLPQRHRGCSLSHMHYALEFFDSNPSKQMYIVMEDDAFPVSSGPDRRREWREEFARLLDELSTNTTWKVVVLSPLLGPGLVVMSKHSARLRYLNIGTNLSNAMVLYHRRCIPHLRGWKRYYHTERASYIIGVDRMLMTLPRDQVLLCSLPMVEQFTAFPSDNPFAVSQSIAIPAQVTSHKILRATARAPHAAVLNVAYAWIHVDTLVRFLILLSYFLLRSVRSFPVYVVHPHFVAKP